MVGGVEDRNCTRNSTISGAARDATIHSALSIKPDATRLPEVGQRNLWCRQTTRFELFFLKKGEPTNRSIDDEIRFPLFKKNEDLAPASNPLRRIDRQIEGRRSAQIKNEQTKNDGQVATDQ